MNKSAMLGWVLWVLLMVLGVTMFGCGSDEPFAGDLPEVAEEQEMIMCPADLPEQLRIEILYLITRVQACEAQLYIKCGDGPEKEKKSKSKGHSKSEGKGKSHEKHDD